MKRDRLQEMQLPEGFRKLIHRLQRGMILFRVLYLGFAGCAGAALLFHGGVPWAIIAFILCLVCRLAVLISVGPRYRMAWKIMEDPQIVYWGHSIDGQGQFTDTAVAASNKIKLHLKNGGHLDVEAVRGTGTSQEQLREVISWLGQKNPSIRWGNYEQPVPEK